MPLTCPRCQIVQADENQTCINCGRPLTPAPAGPDAPSVDAAKSPAGHDGPIAPDPVHAVRARRASWQLPALIAVGLLLALAVSALRIAQQRSAPRSPLSAQAVQPPAVPPATNAAPPTPAPTPPAASVPPVPAADTTTTPKTPAKTDAKTPAKMTMPAVPLTVTLDSTREGRHVRVGEDVTLTALAHGPSATLTLFYRRAQGKKTMLTFVEGSLCSTTWTPAVPGRYEFTANAVGERSRSAVSRRVEITVDAAAPQEAARAAPPPPRPARQTPGTEPPKTAARGRNRPPGLTYHVAAAKFPFLRSATVLSDALNRRGYRAVPERMADTQGKTVYVVVTGAYRRPKEARAAALALQRSGYPAYLFGSR